MKTCGYASEYLYLGNYIFSWISVTMFSDLPVTIMIVCNLMIIFVVCKTSRNKHLKESKTNKKSRSGEKFVPVMLGNNIFSLVTTFPIDFYYQFAAKL